ncbi:MAG: protein-L-isoaspartate(D-aspartate) O-methyltransferase [Gammaproteobacteria bacterium]|nr:protein-L-isoaspartate(D-aspartate) O-methyltransferase [Gammaproteobacteria bacterium]
MSVELNGIGMTSQRTRDRLVDRLKSEGIRNEQVLDVIRNTPRHIFMDEAISSRAYEDTALPIGHGQTISQPYIVARMTEALLEGARPRKVLEIGTGSGYQTAVLAQLVDEVYSIERISALLEQARLRLGGLNLHNIRYLLGDGHLGWKDMGPFEAIIVTAAPVEIPHELLEQLSDGGKLILPAGPSGAQQLMLVTREGEEFHRQLLDRVSFVPLKEGIQQ